MKYDHLLLDSRNILYRAIYAGLADEQFMKSEQDFSVIFFRFINCYFNKFKPKNVHFFWDSEKTEIWRKKIFSEYKDGRLQTKHTEHNVNEILSKCTESIISIVPNINCRNYKLNGEEADDLIYAFCKKKSPEKIIIISSDGDFRQIPFFYKNVDLYHPNADNIHPMEEINPIEIKCFMGEKGDNIPGYNKIGPVNAKNLVIDSSLRRKFFIKNGCETYLRNAKLIDLSLNPSLLENCLTVDILSSKKIKFDIEVLKEIIKDKKINGLSSEISRSILGFKFIG